MPPIVTAVGGAVERASYRVPVERRRFPRLPARRLSAAACVELDGSVVGYGIMSIGAGEAHMLNVCIRADLRGRGVGRRMLMLLLERARRPACGKHSSKCGRRIRVAIAPLPVARLRAGRRAQGLLPGRERPRRRAVLKLDLASRAVTAAGTMLSRLLTLRAPWRMI